MPDALNLTVRDCDENDIESLTKIMVSDFFKEILQHCKSKSQVFDSFNKKLTQSTLGRSEFIVAESNNKVVGYAAMTHGDRSAHCEVGVDPSHHKSGIARQLVVELISRAKKNKTEKLVAICGIHNQASQYLAIKFGFKFKEECRYGTQEYIRYELDI